MQEVAFIPKILLIANVWLCFEEWNTGSLTWKLSIQISISCSSSYYSLVIHRFIFWKSAVRGVYASVHENPNSQAAASETDPARELMAADNLLDRNHPPSVATEV